MVADILTLNRCTLVQLLGVILEFSHIDAPLLRQVLTGNLGQADGLGDTGLNWLRVGHINGKLQRFKGGHGVAGLLGNLLTDIVFIFASIALSITLSIAMSISISITMSITMSIALSSDITGGYHDGITHLCGGDFNALGWQSLRLGLVGGGADLSIHHLSGLSAHSGNDIYALFIVFNNLDIQLNSLTAVLNGRLTYVNGLTDVHSGAAQLWSFISICRLMVGWTISTIGRCAVRDSSCKGHQGNESKNLKDIL